MVRTMILGLLLLAACSRPSDEQRIRETITAMQQAMENHEPRAFMAHVDDDFVGAEASFDRNALANLLRAEVFRNDDLGVALGPIDVELQDNRATVSLTATFTGGSGGWLPERGSIYSITSSWKRKGSDWVCYGAKWEQKL